MSKSNLSSKNLKVGDLVTHILYGKEWIGIIVNLKEDKESKRVLKDDKALVQIQPGTKHAGFFSRISGSGKVNDNLGYVSIHWLFKVKEKNENTRSSRNKTLSGRRNNKKVP